MANVKKLKEFINQRNPKKERKEIIIQPTDVAEYIKIIGKEITGNKFSVDSNNKKVYSDLAKYFLANKGFEKGNYTVTAKGVTKEYPFDNNKGILIMGSVGTGKTDLMRIFSNFLIYAARKKITEVNCKVVAENFSIDGYKYLQQFHNQTRYYFFDDLGEEDGSKHYGEEENVMATILSRRYDSWRQYGLLTFATTNLNGEMLSEKYGERAFERISEMFNFIILTGESRRHLKKK